MDALRAAAAAPSRASAALAALIRAHPLAAVAVSNAALAAAALYVVSDGRPLHYIWKQVFRAALSAVPASVMDAEMGKLRSKIEGQVIGHSLDGEETYRVLPAQGLPRAAVMDALERYSAKDKLKWNSGKISGAVYHGGQDLVDIAAEAAKRYALANPLHPDVFPMLRKMESEVVSMCCAAFHGGADACGTMTSGGTESILMAVKTYRDMARALRGVREPELLAPVTAHAAFDKACAYFGVRLVHLPVNPVTFRVEAAAYAKALTPNTIGLVASAVSYPQGVLDPIPEIAALAVQKGLPLHVDCCLGSLLICHAAAAGFPMRHAFDFAVPGVASISMDTHKYGFSPKGSSVVMYASRKLRQYQYFVAPEWTGGIYASPSIAGSRPGAVIAATWATMVTLGERGYVEAARTILTAARAVSDGVAALSAGRDSQLCLYGAPDLSVVAFGAKPGAPLNIYNVNDAMSAKGWNLNVMQNPACMHLCVTFANAARAEEFVRDLAEAELDVRTAPKGKYADGSGAIYGLAASIPDKSLVGEVCFSFLDSLYKVPA